MRKNARHCEEVKKWLKKIVDRCLDRHKCGVFCLLSHWRPCGRSKCSLQPGTCLQKHPRDTQPRRCERWYQRSLELTPEQDRLQRARGLGHLGGVAYERFREAREAGAAKDEIVRHIQTAEQRYLEALNLTPANALQDRAVCYGQLGNIYGDAGMLKQALEYFSESIRLFEQANNFYEASRYRYNVALALARAGRLHEALVYVETAE